MRANIASGILAACLAIALVPSVPAATPGHVAPVLVEVQPNPEGLDRGAEWFELYNPTPVNLALDGYYVTDHDACTGQPTYSLDGVVLPAFGRAAFTLPNGTSCMVLVNSADELALVGPTGHVLQEVAWGGVGRDAPAVGDGEAVAACVNGLGLHTTWSIAAPTKGAPNAACGA